MHADTRLTEVGASTCQNCLIDRRLGRPHAAERRLAQPPDLATSRTTERRAQICRSACKAFCTACLAGRAGAVRAFGAGASDRIDLWPIVR
jgi:hypothetical protein